MNKKIPVLVVSLGLLYFAYMGRSLLVQLVWDFTSIYSNSKEYPFPLGEGKKISLSTPVNLIRKPYGLTLKTEAIGSHDGKPSPVKLRVKVYRMPLFNSSKAVVFDGVVDNNSAFVRYDGTNNRATQQILFLIKEPPGKLFFEIEDLTQPSLEHNAIKTNLKLIIYNRKL